jgi:hypothetical protein
LHARATLDDEDLASLCLQHARFDRVGRIPLPDRHAGFRTYLGGLWEGVLSGATDEQTRAVALDAASIVIRYINVAAALAGEAEQLLKAQCDRVRRDLLDDLLAGHAPAAGSSPYR